MDLRYLTVKNVSAPLPLQSLCGGPNACGCSIHTGAGSAS